MAETREITRLYEVTDTESCHERIGDIDGGMFDDTWLTDHLEAHGPERLIMRLAAQQRQVVNTWYDIERKRSEENAPAIATAQICKDGGYY